MKMILSGLALGCLVLLGGCTGAVCNDAGFGEYSAKAKRLADGKIGKQKSATTATTQATATPTTRRKNATAAAAPTTASNRPTRLANNTANTARTNSRSRTNNTPLAGTTATALDAAATKTQEVRAYVRNLTRKVFNRWLAQTGYAVERNGKPRLIITQIENRSDLNLTEAEVRNMFSDFATEDGRYNVVVATTTNGHPDEDLMHHILNDPYYSNNGMAISDGKALQCYAKIQVAQVATTGVSVTEDYLIDVTLSDIENREIVISDWDILGIQENVR